MTRSMDSLKLWLFRSLVAIAVGLMIASFIMPWWTADIVIPGETVLPPDAIRIYGHGLRHSLVELRHYVAADETPFYQTVLAWIYLAASVGLALGSTWLKGRKNRWLLGGTGLIYIAYAAIAAFVIIAGRLGDMGLSLQGWTTIEREGWSVTIFARLRFGYYLAYGAGLMCIALALLRDKIIGKAKLSA